MHRLQAVQWKAMLFCTSSQLGQIRPGSTFRSSEMSELDSDLIFFRYPGCDLAARTNVPSEATQVKPSMYLKITVCICGKTKMTYDSMRAAIPAKIILEIILVVVWLGCLGLRLLRAAIRLEFDSPKRIASVLVCYRITLCTALCTERSV